MGIEIGPPETLRGLSGGIRSGSKYAVVADGVPGEVRVDHLVRFRNPKEQHSEDKIQEAIKRLVAREQQRGNVKPEFTFDLNLQTARGVGLSWEAEGQE